MMSTPGWKRETVIRKKESWIVEILFTFYHNDKTFYPILAVQGAYIKKDRERLWFEQTISRHSVPNNIFL